MKSLNVISGKLITLVFLLTIVVSLSGCKALQNEGSHKEASENNKILKVYCFGDYFDPEILEMFEEETGIHVIVDSFDTNEEMFPVIDKETVTYDAVCTSDYMISKLIERGKLWPLDKTKLVNLSNIDESFLKLVDGFDFGQNYCIPHTFGTMGIMYDQTKVSENELDNWQDLWNSKFKDEMVLPDSMRDLMAIALKKNGASINSENPKDIEEAGAALSKQKPLVYKYANDSAKDMVLGGAVPLAVVWSGEVLYSKEENENICYQIPDEGTEVFMDAWVIPKAAEHKENALKWMNFLMRPDIAVKNFQYLYFAIPNKAVIDLVSKKPEDMKILFPREEILEKSEFLKALPPAVEDIYSKVWKKFKST